MDTREPLNATEPEIPIEEIVATTLLRTAVAAGSESLGAYSGWLLGGIAAALGIVLSNLEPLLRFVTLEQIRGTAIALVVALALGVVARYVGMIASAGARSGQQAAQTAPNPGIDVDFGVVLDHVERVTWRPARWLLARQLRRLRQGGLLAASGFLFNAAQLHGLLVFLDGVIAIGALAYLTYCLAA